MTQSRIEDGWTAGRRWYNKDEGASFDLDPFNRDKREEYNIKSRVKEHSSCRWPKRRTSVLRFGRRALFSMRAHVLFRRSVILSAPAVLGCCWKPVGQIWMSFLRHIWISKGKKPGFLLVRSPRSSQLAVQSAVCAPGNEFPLIAARVLYFWVQAANLSTVSAAAVHTAGV